MSSTDCLHLKFEFRQTEVSVASKPFLRRHTVPRVSSFSYNQNHPLPFSFFEGQHTKILKFKVGKVTVPLGTVYGGRVYGKEGKNTKM